MAMPATTPAQRLQRVLREGARLLAVQHGQTSIDMTPDIIALLDGVQTNDAGCKPGRNLFEPKVHGREVRTHVHFP